MANVSTVDDLRSVVDEIGTRHPVVGLGVGVVSDGRLEEFAATGVADSDTGSPITQDTVFRIASVTKTMTGIAVMQLVERGLIDLDTGANEYLKSFRLVPRGGDQEPTVRHLLTHTAGLPEVARLRGLSQPDFGESVPCGEPLPTLAEFYRGALPLRAEPGSRFVYGNHSPATLGQIVEDVTGRTLNEIFAARIFEPLGMSDSSAVRVPRLERRRATGYEIGRRVRRVEERDMITTGAASVYSTPADMARYLAALLGGGANRHGSVLEPETLATMFDAHYQPDPRVPGMGLSFFRYFINGALVVGHQGSHPGFHSQLFAAPHDGVGVLGFTNGAYQPDMWLPAELANLLARRLGSSTERGSAPHRPDIWEGLCGTYRLNAAATDVRLRAMVGLGAQVFVAGGRLMLRFLTPIPDLYRGFELRAVPGTDPYLFEADVGDDMVQMHAAFCQTAGSTDRVVIDLMPLVLYKRTRRSRRRSERTMAEGS